MLSAVLIHSKIQPTSKQKQEKKDIIPLCCLPPFLGVWREERKRTLEIKHLLPGHKGESETKSCNLMLSEQAQLNHLVPFSLTVGTGET